MMAGGPSTQKRVPKGDKITFLASLPPIPSAIMVDGTGDSMTVKLQIPLNKCPQALRLNLMTQRVLKVTIAEIIRPQPKPADKAKEARHWTPRKEKIRPTKKTLSQ
jgi:hypothetical protein